MKKLILIFSLVFIIFSCVDENRSEVKVNVKNEEFLQEFSDKKVAENVISPKEAVSEAIESMQRDHAELTKEVLDENPEWANATIGTVELIEDFSSPSRKEEPYFYYINAVMPDGKIIVDFMVNAMEDLEGAGEVGIISIIGQYEEFSSTTRTKEEAYEYLVETLSLNRNESYEIKAILPSSAGINIFDWGWAIKTESNYKVRNSTTEENEANVFFVNAYNYTLSSKRTEDDVKYFSNLEDISILEGDVFDAEFKNSDKMNVTDTSMIKSVYKK